MIEVGSMRGVPWLWPAVAIPILFASTSCKRDSECIKDPWVGYKSADGSIVDVSEIRPARSTFEGDAKERLSRFLAIQGGGEYYESPSGCAAVASKGGTFEVRAALFGPHQGWVCLETKAEWGSKLDSYPDERISSLLKSLRRAAWSVPTTPSSVRLRVLGEWKLPKGWFSMGEKFGAEPGEDLGVVEKAGGFGVSIQDHRVITGPQLDKQLGYAGLRPVGRIGKIELLEWTAAPHHKAYLVRSDLGAVVLKGMYGVDSPKDEDAQVLGLARDIQRAVDEAKAKDALQPGQEK